MHSSKGQVIYLIKMNPIYFGSKCRISEVNKMTDLIKMDFQSQSKKTTQKKLVAFLSNLTVISYCGNY